MLSRAPMNSTLLRAPTRRQNPKANACEHTLLFPVSENSETGRGRHLVSNTFLIFFLQAWLPPSWQVSSRIPGAFAQHVDTGARFPANVPQVFSAALLPGTENLLLAHRALWTGVHDVLWKAAPGCCRETMPCAQTASGVMRQAEGKIAFPGHLSSQSQEKKKSFPQNFTIKTLKDK